MVGSAILWWPIFIGVSGDHAWNSSGSPLEKVVESLDILRGHCETEGRDFDAIELTVSFPVSIRDTVEAARAAALERFRANGVENTGTGPHLAGPPEVIAEAIAPYRDLGFETVVFRLPAPFDHETIERMPEVAAALG